MRTKIILVTIILLLTASAIPRPISDNTEYNYENYLFSLEVLKCDDTVATGESGSINVKVGARTEVDLYIEFKGKYQWGHWAFSSEKVALEPGVNVVKEEFPVPQGGPGFGYYFVDDVKWSGVVWTHYDEMGSPFDPQGVWEVGIEGLPELWYTMCIVDSAEYKQHVLVAEGTFLDAPLQGLDFTYTVDLTSDRWTLEGEGFYFTGFINADDT